MPSIGAWLVLAGVSAACLTVCRAAAEDPPDLKRTAVELAPFAGFQFGGSVSGASYQPVTLGAGLSYGAAVDVRVTDFWMLEAFYSRQETNVGAVGATVERYMGGIMEERGDGATRFFGVGLLGATRFVPGPPRYGSLARFTVGVGLGVKHRFSNHLGIRAEGHGYFVTSATGGGLFCSGGCLFVFRGSALWQGDLSAGLALAF